MVWVLFWISQHPEVEAKIVAELDGLGLLAAPGKAQPRRLEWDDLPKLHYVEAVTKV